MSNEARITEWISKLNAPYGKYGYAALEIGKLLEQAKAGLSQNGLWTKFLKSEALPFSKRKGEMLLRVLTELGDLDPQTFAQMPSGWSILHELSFIDREQMNELVAQGTIHPRLTLAQARELAGRAMEARQQGAKEWMQRLISHVSERADDWKDDERQFVGSGFAKLARQMEQAPPSGRRNKSGCSPSDRATTQDTRSR